MKNSPLAKAVGAAFANSILCDRRTGRVATVASCIGIITGCILLSNVEAAWWVPGHEPSYVAHSYRPVRNPQIYNPSKRITRRQLANLAVHKYYAPGQSTRAMRSLLGSPYASSPEAQIEWFPLREQPQDWLGVMYDRKGRYVDYTLSFNNTVVAEPTIEQVVGVTRLSNNLQDRNSQVAAYMERVRKGRR